MLFFSRLLRRSIFFPVFLGVLSFPLVTFSESVKSSSDTLGSVLATLNEISQQIGQLLQQQQISSQQDQGYRQTVLGFFYPVTPYPGWKSIALPHLNLSFGEGVNLSLEKSITSFISPDVVGNSKRNRTAQMSAYLLKDSPTPVSRDLSVEGSLGRYSRLDVGQMSGVQVERASFELLLLNTQVNYMNYAAQEKTQVLLNNILMSQSLLLSQLLELSREEKKEA